MKLDWRHQDASIYTRFQSHQIQNRSEALSSLKTSEKTIIYLENYLFFVRRTYKVYARARFIPHEITRSPVTLDAGAGSLFIPNYIIPRRQWWEDKNNSTLFTFAQSSRA